jgi:hypothetical protein
MGRSLNWTRLAAIVTYGVAAAIAIATIIYVIQREL